MLNLLRNAIKKMRRESREARETPAAVIDATPLGDPSPNPPREPGGATQKDDDCKCQPPPPGDESRNLVVCIDGTANQFGEKVCHAIGMMLEIAQHL